MQRAAADFPNTDGDIFSAKDIADGDEYSTLGPAYFCSRSVVERAMAKIVADDFKPLVKDITQQINDVIWSKVADHLLSDTEMNLQGAMYRQVDDCVKALLSGEKWALKRYALGPRYDAEKIREAVATHIPAEIQDARIADLQAANEQLRKDIEFYRRDR